jgi:dTDP-4-amino-4,6-dideoxygalactose transaminase
VGAKLNSWKVPLSDIDIGPDEIEAVAEVMRSRWLTMGPRTEQFEQAFANLHGAAHAVAVSSCTAALHLAYAALDIGPGDEVIMPAMTFVATANAAVVCGATPVFADIIGEDEPTVDPNQVASLITPRTRAIAVVHYAGYACRMNEIMALAERHQLPVVEDCAHAPVVRHGDRYLGTVGAIGCFSFFSNKNMTTGEGGMVVTRDDELASRIRLLRSHGMTTGTWARHNERPADYDVLEAGWNYRIDEIRSAIGLVQLRKLAGANAARAGLTAQYRRRLEQAPGAAVAFRDYSGDSAHHILPLVAADPVIRKGIVDKLAEAGVQTSHHYPPIHLFKLYGERFGCRQGQLPLTESFATREITLPLYSKMTTADVNYVATVVEDAVQNAAGKPSRMGRAS